MQHQQNHSNSGIILSFNSHRIQSHDGDVLYAWLRLEDPFCCIGAGLDGDH
jgi:hypothetical protein